MSEEIKNKELKETQLKELRLSEEDLDNVSGGLNINVPLPNDAPPLPES